MFKLFSFGTVQGQTVTVPTSPPRTSNFIYLQDGQLRVMLPLSTGSHIALDNTCQAAKALKQALGLARNSAQASVFDELERYKRELQTSKAMTAVLDTRSKKAPDPYGDLIKQVDQHITLLQEFVRSPEIQRTLAGTAFPKYPQCFETMMNSSDSNVSGVRLSPVIYDSFLAISDPVFTMKRPTLLTRSTPRGYLYRALTSMDLGSAQIPTGRRLNPETLTNQVHRAMVGWLGLWSTPIKDISAFKTKLVTELQNSGVFADRDSITHSLDTIIETVMFEMTDIFEASGHQAEMKGDGLTTVSSMIEHVISNAGADFSRVQDGPDTLSSPFDAIANKSDERTNSQQISCRQDAASLTVQFLLAHINIHVKRDRIFSDQPCPDFGKILEDNPFLSSSLATAVAQAINNGCDVEQVIFNFVNENHPSLSMSRVLNEADVEAIKAAFTRNHAILIAGQAPHWDEFAIFGKAPSGKSPVFHSFRANLVLSLAEILKRFPHVLGRALTSTESSFVTQQTSTPIATAELEHQPQTSEALLDDSFFDHLSRNLQQNNTQQVSALLFECSNGRLLFEHAPPKFWHTLINNYSIRAALENLHQSISDPAISARFNQAVFKVSSQLVLTRKDARALHAAVQHRRSLPAKNSGCHHTADDIRTMLAALAEQAQLDAKSADLSCLKEDYTVRAGDNGQFTIEAPQATITRLQSLVEQYQQSLYVSIDMAMSIYLQVEKIYGKDSPERQAMNQLTNNDPNDPGRPFKFVEALRLLGISVTPNQVSYNNVCNELPFEDQINKDDRRPKKGGKGFIIHMCPDQVAERLAAFTMEHANGLTISASENAYFLDAIAQTITRLGGDPARSGQASEGAPPTLEDILYNLRQLGFNLPQVIDQGSPEAWKIRLELDRTQRAALKLLAKRCSLLPEHIAFNHQDRELTDNGNLTFRLHDGTAPHTSFISTTLPSRMGPARASKTFVLDLQAAEALYTAVADRMSLQLEQVGKYQQLEDIQRLMQQLSEQGYRGLERCGVERDANHQFVITGPQERLADMRNITNEYKHSTHITMEMAGSCYKEINSRLGLSHPKYNAMQALDNNKGDGIPYKFLECLRLLNLITLTTNDCQTYEYDAETFHNLPAKQRETAFQRYLNRTQKIPNSRPAKYKIRYNNTCNSHPFETTTNKGDSQSKKGGGGFIWEGIPAGTRSMLDTINQTRRNQWLMDGFFDACSSYFVTEHLKESYDTPAGRARRNELEALTGEDYDVQERRIQLTLNILGIDYTRVAVQVSQTGAATLVIEGIERKGQAMLAMCIQECNGGDPVHQSISLTNKEMMDLVQPFMRSGRFSPPLCLDKPLPAQRPEPAPVRASSPPQLLRSRVSEATSPQYPPRLFDGASTSRQPTQEDNLQRLKGILQAGYSTYVGGKRDRVNAAYTVFNSSLQRATDTSQLWSDFLWTIKNNTGSLSPHSWLCHVIVALNKHENAELLSQLTPCFNIPANQQLQLSHLAKTEEISEFDSVSQVSSSSSSYVSRFSRIFSRRDNTPADQGKQLRQNLTQWLKGLNPAQPNQQTYR